MLARSRLRATTVRLQSFGLAFGASADPGSSLIDRQLFWSQSFGEIVLANERSPCRCLLDPNKVMHLADHAAYLRGVLQINDAANSSLRNRFAAWVGRAANCLKRRPIQCPLRTFATETRCPRDFRFFPDSDHRRCADTSQKCQSTEPEVAHFLAVSFAKGTPERHLSTQRPALFAARRCSPREQPTA
jgi:hypothetical protein